MARILSRSPIKNTSSHAIGAPFDIVVDDLTSGSTLVNATGVTSCALPAGSPSIRLTDAPLWLAPNASVKVSLNVKAPSKANGFKVRVLTGSAGR